MATVGEYPHQSDLTDEQLVAIVRECADWREFSDRVRGPRSAIKKRLRRLGVSDQLANGSDMLRDAGVKPKTGHRFD